MNRIDTESKFPFQKVQRIMVSAPLPYPHREDYKFVHVLLFTDKEIPLMLPYLYKCGGNDGEKAAIDGEDVGAAEVNDLSEWLFVNGNGESVRHRVDNFTH